MTNPLGTNLGGSAPFCERGDTAKGKLMYLARGGALTALTLIIATGCGGSDAGPVLGANGDAGPVVVEGPQIPDGGAPEVPLPPAPPPPADGKPVEGVFVSSSKGSDDADATMLRPVKTLARAMAIAAEKKTLPVIACAETYNEAVKLTDGVTMYGYFDCSGTEWKKVTKRAKIVSPTSPAVLADGLKLPVRFEGFEMTAPDMTGTPAAGVAAASSYGMIVKATKGLSLGDLFIRAGSAQDGVDGAEPADGNANLQDSSGEPGDGPLKKVCTRFGCNFDNSVVVPPPATSPGSLGGTSSCKVGPNGGDGGEGGGGRISNADGNYRAAGYNADDIRGRPLSENATTVAGSASGAGSPGTPGPSGTFGVNGGWSFAETGFFPADGTSGSNGKPGKGGGGGFGRINYGTQLPRGPGGPEIEKLPPQGDVWRTGIGGGGGAGGCGGIAGAGGRGGGASVGLFVVGSLDVTISNSRVEAGKAGRAGKGAAGTSGTAGGAGGAKGTGASGSAGGKGGDGGLAGQSGHGSAGPSIALVFKGARPTMTKVDLVAGQAGEGAAAVVRDGQSLPAVTGEAKAEHSF